MKNLKITFAAILGFILFAPALTAQDIFISPAEFMKVIKDKNTKVISAQKEKNYKISHVKGAVYINQSSLNKPGKPEGILKSPAELAKIFGSKGISEKNLIVIYDDGKNKNSARIYWVLKYLGAPNVRLLHKDMSAWRKSRVPVTKAPTKVTAVTFTPKIDKSVFTDYNWVKSHLNDSKVVLVDARHVTEFNGTSTKPVSKGHIKGAKNIEWKELEKENGALKSDAELLKIFTSKGITKDKTVVLYCATSVRAGIMYVALKKLGYKNVKVYDGAYNEWVSKGAPVVK